MMLHRLGLINKNERGFTLIELLVAMTITVLIAGGIATTIYQVFGINTLSINHMLAVRQVQNAGYWISHDAQMAKPQSINAGSVPIDDTVPDHPLYPQADGQTQVLYLTWAGWTYECGGNDTCTDTYEVYYTYDAASSKLWRYQRITTEKRDSNGDFVETTYNPGPTVDDDWGATFIADYITSIADVEIYMDGDKLVVEVTATVGEAEETRTYETTPRPSSQ